MGCSHSSNGSGPPIEANTNRRGSGSGETEPFFMSPRSSRDSGGGGTSSQSSSALKPKMKRAPTCAGLGADGEDEADLAMHTFGSIDAFSDMSRDSARRGSMSAEYAVMQSPDVSSKPGLRRGASFAGNTHEATSFVGIQALSLKGLKAECPNQDSWIVLRSGESWSVYGVFDGHGKFGHVISAYVKGALPRMILDDRRLGIVDTKIVVTEAFARMTKQVEEANRMGKIPAEKSGTTATVAVHDHNKATLTVAHVGDSGCSIVQGTSFKGKYLTPDHKPNLPSESKRITKAGGSITFDGSTFRVHKKGGNGPMLNMSRSVGDLWGKDIGVCSEPDVIQLKISASDQLLVICSDGVWEHMTAQDVADNLKEGLKKKPTGVAHGLAIAAQDLWNELSDTSDDITVVLVSLPEQAGAPPEKKSLMKRSESTVGDLLSPKMKRSDSRGSVNSEEGDPGSPGPKSALKRTGSTINGGSIAAQKARSAMRNAVIANAMAKGGREAFVGKLARVESERPGGSFCREDEMVSMGSASTRTPGTPAPDRSALAQRLANSRNAPRAKMPETCELLETEGREMFPQPFCNGGIRRAGGYHAAPEHNAV
mmetsp:Transcript_29793/g.86443  ORF Transcript_29793/g.86443 Transcript_29793/m.86443 type:complete len:597 (+) Transcript_29793:161-1951(+)